MPWFGLDIGETMVKLVYFEPLDHNEFVESDEEIVRLRTIKHYLITNKAYSETGIRDAHLILRDVKINGRTGAIHFVRFLTHRMRDFIALAKSKGFVQTSSTICATGRSAVKYAREVETELDVQFHKTDELESLIKGIEIVAANNPDECYYYDNPLEDEKCTKVIWRSSAADVALEGKKQSGLQYPYVVCNIGSGVSVLAVRDHSDFERISGSSIGGGFFQGVCAITCGSNTVEEAIELASKGDNKNVDKLVQDINGAGYDQMGLPGDIVAASFGKILSAKDGKNVRKEDLARSVLVTTVNNIGSIAFYGAEAHGIDRIVFVGNFLRVNPIAARLLSHAMTFWSKGTKKALFLMHEGYFGAVGCLDKLVDLTEMRRRTRAMEQLHQTDVKEPDVGNKTD